MTFAQLRKAAVALAGTVATWAVAALLDDTVTASEWAALALALTTAGGVYGVRNAPATSSPPAVPEQAPPVE